MRSVRFDYRVTWDLSVESCCAIGWVILIADVYAPYAGVLGNGIATSRMDVIETGKRRVIQKWVECAGGNKVK